MKHLKDNDQRQLIPLFRQPEFLVRARFEMQCTKMETDDRASLPVLNEIAYTSDLFGVYYYLIVTRNCQQYLMNAEGEYCSDGYDRITQLLNKTPSAEAHLIERNKKFGVLSAHGELLIPCVYRQIELLKRLQIHGHDDEDKCIDSITVCFYICENDEGMYDLYSHDGVLLFREAADIIPGEERIQYDYNFHTRNRIQTQTLETIHVYASLRENGIDYYRRYAYALKEDSNEQIIFDYIGSEGDEQVPEDPPIPLGVPHIEKAYTALSVNTGYGRRLCKYLCSLLSDESIYAYIAPEEIRWDYITRLKQLALSMMDNRFSRLAEPRKLRFIYKYYIDLIESLEKLERVYKQA